MKISIQKRTFIKILSFIVAVIIVLSGFLALHAYKGSKMTRQLEYGYMRSMNELSTHLNSINADLKKCLYTNTPNMLSNLSVKLLRETSLAKMSLEDLPIEYLDLQSTYKLLSQLGEYSMSISTKFKDGEKISDKDRTTLKSLYDLSENVLSDVLILNDMVQTKSIGMLSSLDISNQKLNAPADTLTLSSSFSETSKGLDEYPSLIYDGPFSDHILEKEPLYIKGKPNITKAQAQEAAAKILGVEVNTLKDGNNETSKINSYEFYSNLNSISITKQGGYLCYLINPREISEVKIDKDTALKRATAFLEKCYGKEFTVTYYETNSNTVTFNFAATQNNITLYTDLIKVSVALDNGEITGFDARGYIVNHFKRTDIKPLNTEAQAKKSVSPFLTIKSSRLAIIPNNGLKETLCYEFKCEDSDKKNVLVYINTDTLQEEQILILVIDENGQLTL